MRNRVGFAAELEVTTRRGSFSIRGDEKRIVVTFSSLLTMMHVLRVMRGNRMLGSLVSRTAPSYFIETQVSGRSVAVSGPGFNSNFWAKLVGVGATRVNLRNLIASLFSSANLKR